MSRSGATAGSFVFWSLRATVRTGGEPYADNRPEDISVLVDEFLRAEDDRQGEALASSVPGSTV